VLGEEETKAIKIKKWGKMSEQQKKVGQGKQQSEGKSVAGGCFEDGFGEW